VDRDAFGFDLSVRRRDAEEFACMHAAAGDQSMLSGLATFPP
jgi:hypothetical protein